MKYFTKEWYKDTQKTDIHLLMSTTRKADKFDEKYFRNLYKKELNQFLKDEKEMCEMTEEDLFDESDWDEISVLNEDGHMINVSEIMSQEEVNELRNNILNEEKEVAENFEIEPYDEEKLIKQFEENHVDKIECLKESLPVDILKDVADIRVLALDKASRHIKKRIEKYCRENEKRSDKVINEYSKYFGKIKNNIPKKILENYEFHDCEILSIEKIGNDIIFNLDNSGGFADVNKIKYKNAKILENNLDENAYWIYDEIYVLDEGYEFHIGISANNEYDYDYISITATDVDFEYNEN